MDFLISSCKCVKGVVNNNNSNSIVYFWWQISRKLSVHLDAKGFNFHALQILTDCSVKNKEFFIKINKLKKTSSIIAVTDIAHEVYSVLAQQQSSEESVQVWFWATKTTAMRTKSPSKKDEHAQRVATSILSTTLTSLEPYYCFFLSAVRTALKV